MNRAANRRPKSLRFALLARVSTVALIAAASFAHDAFAKPPSANAAGNGGGGGIGRNPNDLKDGDIDGNAGNGHHNSQPPPPQDTTCDGGNGVVGTINVTNATPMPLTGAIECVTVNTTVEHDVVSEATVGDPGSGHSSFVVGSDGVITGELWNKGTITGGYASLGGSGLGALTIFGDVQDGVRNTGLITSPGNNAIQVGSSSDGVLLPGSIEGGITNSGSIGGANDGLAMIAGSLTGGLTNNEGAAITGGNAAVYIADTFDSWADGITNAGSLHGTGVGILIGAPGAKNVEFSGGISNAATGVISSGSGPAIFASGASYDGGLTNWGLITETGEEFADVYGGSGVVLDALTVAGDIANHGEIEGVHRQGLLITNNVGLFDGSISNDGEITGAAGGVVVLASTVNGNFSNSGFIGGGGNTGVAYFNSLIEGVGGEGATATFTNTGTITGAAGFVVDAQTVVADFVNGDAETGAGAITGETSAGLILAAQSWTGDITNNGSINGATVGMAVGYDPFFGKAPPNNELTGNIVNHGWVHGDTAGLVITVDTFSGDFTNNGSITGGQYGVALQGGGNFQGSFLAALCLECFETNSLGGGSFTGNVVNNDFMSGNTALFVSYDTFTGNLTNSATGLLQGVDHGLLIDVDDFQGNFSNAGTITAGGEGAWGVAAQIGTGTSEGGTVLGGQSFTGDIGNSGLLHGQNTGLAVILDSYSAAGGGEGFTNSGTIRGDYWTGLIVNVNSWAGNLTNEAGGLIEGGFDGVYINAGAISGNVTNDGSIIGSIGKGLVISSNVSTFDGIVSNTGQIDGAEGGVVVLAQTVRGNFINSGNIAGGFYTGVAYFNNSIEGVGGEGATASFTNTGSITGATGFVIDAETVRADFVNGDAETGAGSIIGNSGAGLSLGAQSWTGDIVNNGSIHGGTAGVVIAIDDFTGDFTNNGSITGGQYGVALQGGSDDFEGAFFAASCIECVQTFSLNGGTFSGNVTNNDFMSGNTALFVSYDSFTGNLTNAETGVLRGADYGLLVDVDDFQGNFSNAGTIMAGSEGEVIGVAVQIGTGTSEGGSVSGGQSFVGDVSNSGLLHGQNTGLAIALDSYGTAAGGEGFTNSGTILGDNWTGLFVNVNSWSGNFTNEAGAVIEGGFDGMYINAGTINGNFTNDGSIIGHAYDTGWSINTPSFTGNIANGVAGLITAPSNALHLKINSFSGQISNAGIIAASSGNAVVLEGYNANGVYTGTLTNTGSILADSIGIYLSNSKITGGIDNNGGTIDAATAISTYSATAATTITNQGGGVIIGDLRLSSNFGDTFIAKDGGIVGDIIGDPGSGNDDTVIVENGAQYFLGKASNLAAFTVDDGGTALMGAESEGDTGGSGYSFSNADAINVNNGGVLYIDKSTTLTAGTYTQQSGGTLEFYLAAPGGAGFSSLTGDQIAAPGDYGQVHLTGAATLDGSIAGYLDPAFANANADLTSVTYEDVLVADGGITGDFTTLALISNSSLFELNEEIDGDTVDLTVTRTGLGQIGDVGTIVVETGGPWKAMVNDRSNGIGSGSCSLAGPGWCLNAYAANEAAGSSVMTDAMPGADPFNWLRTGQRNPGETAIWGRAVGVWGDTSGDATHAATDFKTYGAIVGVDRVFTPLFMAGVAAQWTGSKIDYDGSSDNARIGSLEVGGYLSYGDARFYLNANTSVIFHDIDVTRFAPGGSARGDYDGTTISGYAEAGRIFELYEGLRLQPLVALSYAHLNTDAYDETGSATGKLHVFEADLDSLKGMLGGRFAYPIDAGGNGKIVPEARVIWSHEFLDDHAAFDANPLTNPLNVATITGQIYNRDSLVLGTGVTAPLSRATTLFLDYDAALNEDITTHTVSGGLRTRW